MTAIAQDIRDAVVATYNAGATLAQAAAQHGVSPTSAQRWVAAATGRQPLTRINRHPDTDASPRIYRGGWTTTRGGIQQPLTNIRNADRPTQGDTAA